MIYGQKFLELSEEFKDVSVEDIKSLSEYCNNLCLESNTDEFVFESSLISICEATGVDKAKITAKSKSAGEKIGKVVKEKGITKESKKEISTILDDALSQIKKEIDKIVVPKSIQEKIDKGEVDRYKIQKAIVLLLLVSTINSIIMTALQLILPGLGLALTAIFVAPITEESAKAVAIKGKYDKEFTIVFNIAEFSQYVIQGAPAALLFGGKDGLKKLVAGRLAAVAMHCTTTIVQKLTQDEKIQKKLGLDKEKDKEQLTFIGRITGMLIHAAWNIMAVYLAK